MKRFKISWLKTLKLLAPYVIAFSFGVSVSYCASNKRADKAVAELEKSKLEIGGLRDSLNVAVAAKRISYDDLVFAIRKDSINSDLERSKAILISKTNKQDDSIISLGTELYGKPTFQNSKRAIVASYGVQGLKDVKNFRKINKNQKARIEAYKQVVLLDQKLEANYEIALQRVAMKKKKRGFLKGLKKVGTIIGGIALIVLGSSL